MLATGCTTVPTREFATYKETFAQARAAGEEVLLDYGAARAQADDVNAKLAAAKAGKKVRGGLFDPSAVGKNSGSMEDVIVRMKAWEVVARYNDLLTALAEGRAADELAGAVDGLSASLTSFPIATVAATAAEVSGYLAPLKPLALEAVRERSRREFIAAVAKGGPLITDKFLKYLREDTVDFYKVRTGLNNLEIFAIAESADKTGKRLVALVSSFQASRDVDDRIETLNVDIALLPVLPRETPLVPPLKVPPQRGSAALTPEARAQVGSLVQDMTAQIGKVAAKDDELNAYRQVLESYVRLLNQLEHSMRGLQTAAEQAQPSIPQAADLQRIVIQLREAYMIFKDKAKE